MLHVIPSLFASAAFPDTYAAVAASASNAVPALFVASFALLVASLFHIVVVSAYSLLSNDDILSAVKDPLERFPAAVKVRFFVHCPVQSVP